MDVFVYVDYDFGNVKVFDSFDAANQYACKRNDIEIEWEYEKDEWCDGCFLTIYKLPIESYKKSEC